MHLQFTMFNSIVGRGVRSTGLVKLELYFARLSRHYPTPVALLISRDRTDGSEPDIGINRRNRVNAAAVLFLSRNRKVLAPVRPFHLIIPNRFNSPRTLCTR